MKKSTIVRLTLLSVLMIFVVLFFWVYLTPVEAAHQYPSGFTPIQDDALASRFVPVIISDDVKNPIIAIYYRAAKADDGSVFIAYHPAWAYEKNEKGTGFMPFLSRYVYTGGLSLQHLMFGKGDIEVITITLNSALQMVSLKYERPDAYSAESFSVKHVTVETSVPEGIERPLFKVTSWNHLFVLDGFASAETARAVSPVQLSYFSDTLWQSYSMVKERQTKIQKNRAHEKWELRSAVQVNQY